MNSTSNPDSVRIRQLGLAGNGVLHSRPEGSNGNHIKCPCNKKKCQNKNFVEVNEARFHLYKYGFVHNYHVWYLHDEIKSSIYGDEAIHNVNVTCHPAITDNVGLLTTFVQMVYDAVGPQFNANIVEESPNPTTQNFYNILNATNQEVWLSCQTHSQLSAITRMLHIKSKHRLFEQCYDALCQFTR